jgi:hypothetical protein
MNDQQPTSPRRRLQELLAIPDRLRTDEQWDELNELEISLASVNRTDAPVPSARRNGPMPDKPPKNTNAGGPPGKKPFKKFHKKPPKGNAPKA